MTALILSFPIPEDDPAKRIVSAARAVLRSAASHTDEILTEACTALQDYGDWMDHLEADAMLLAISLRQHRIRQVERPRPAIRLDDVALILGAVFAVGMFAYVVAL